MRNTLWQSNMTSWKFPHFIDQVSMKIPICTELSSSPFLITWAYPFWWMNAFTYTLFSGEPKQTQRFLHREVEWFWMILVGHDAGGVYMFFEFLLTPMPLCPRYVWSMIFDPQNWMGRGPNLQDTFPNWCFAFSDYDPQRNTRETMVKPMQNPCFDVSYPVFYDLYLRYEMVLRSIGCFKRWLSRLLRGIFQTPGAAVKIHS